MRRSGSAERGSTRLRRARLLLPLAVLGCTCAFVLQSAGWAQTSYMALTKAVTHGTAKVDAWHWESHDISWYKGHYYSVKAPGLVLATLPLYELLHAVGAEKLAHDARVTGAGAGANPWAYKGLQIQQYGYSPAIAKRSKAAIQDDAPMTWALGLMGVLLPTLALLALVAWAANRVAPGTGPAAALTLGVGTMALPFSTLYFSHMLSALLGFAAFALAWRERDGPPRVRLLAVAGLLGGFAITTEYPLAIAAGVVGLYALSRPGAGRAGRARRALAYGGGLAAGVAPLLAYNLWAFGSPFHMSYADAVAKTGLTGHDALGLNDGGIFGITMPRPGDALSLLFGGRGLLTLTPVLVVAIAGVVVMYRSGRRAEARAIGALALAYLVYDAGYWLPFGGGSPGPRFLIPILPFLAVGLGPAWRRWPAVTLALAAASATVMVAATISYPMIGGDDFGEWVQRIVSFGLFQHTLLDVTGVAHGLVAVLPFVIGVAGALALGVRTLGARHLALGARSAAFALGGWALAAAVLPGPLGWAPCTQQIQVCGTTSAVTGNGNEAVLILVAAACGLAAVGLAVMRARAVRKRSVVPALAPASAKAEDHHAAPPRALEPQAAQRAL